MIDAAAVAFDGLVTSAALVFVADERLIQAKVSHAVGADHERSGQRLCRRDRVA